MAPFTRPSVQLESWDGSNITVSVVATTESMALTRARRWVERNVARQMKPMTGRAKRKTERQLSGMDIVTRYYFEFVLGQEER